jgi:hypothetical protein
MFTPEDLAQMRRKNISEARIEAQLSHFRNGFPFLHINRAATPGDGIMRLGVEAKQRSLKLWNDCLEEGRLRVMKFVPASGAASRMFKDLFAFCDGTGDVPNTLFVKQFFEHIAGFAFYDALNAVCKKNCGLDIASLVATSRYKEVVHNLLSADGLHYGALPKGLLLFHRYPSEERTPFLEHLVEGALTANNRYNEVHLCFTVSNEHRQLFEKHFIEHREKYKKQFGIRFDVLFDEQQSSTDTLAVDMDNRPFRQADGTLLFRPAGHGALIENLNSLNADIVFIKNIDNVVPDHLKQPTIDYKQLLAGTLISLQQQVFAYLNELENERISDAKLQIIRQFCETRLGVYNPNMTHLSHDETVVWLRTKLNRPIRVCGMVVNEGEPGGGPYWVENADNTISLQILESSQIDISNLLNKQLMEKSTHFNPVDLVCSLYNYKGEKFNLLDYIDEQTGFISTKSSDGRPLKALEMPGLWNGAMSDWNTLFVEVPIETFNPVKTVNDLLRKQHQIKQYKNL